MSILSRKAKKDTPPKAEKPTFTIKHVILERVSLFHGHGEITREEIGRKVEDKAAEISIQAFRGGEQRIVRLSAEGHDPNGYHFAVSYLVFLDADSPGESVSSEADAEMMRLGSAITFPFLRETLASLTAKAAYGPHYLAPFDARVWVAKMDSGAPVKDDEQ